MIRNKLIVDILLVLLLILSTGGLAFVFNRNLMYLVYFICIFLTIITSAKKPKKAIFYACILSFITILFTYTVKLVVGLCS